MSKTGGEGGRTLQRVDDKNNLLIHIRMTESLKKSQVLAGDGNVCFLEIALFE